MSEFVESLNGTSPPSLGAFRRLADPGPDPALIESLVQEIFSRHSPCQRRRILVFALSRHTRLTGKRIRLAAGLTPSTVTMARKAIGSRTSRNPELAAGLLALAQRLESPLPQVLSILHVRPYCRAILVEDGVYFLNCSSCIHRNAPDAGLCETPEERLWSSWGAFCRESSPAHRPDPFVQQESRNRFVEAKVRLWRCEPHDGVAMAP